METKQMLNNYYYFESFLGILNKIKVYLVLTCKDLLLTKQILKQ